MREAWNPLSIVAAAWLVGLIAGQLQGEGPGVVWLALAAFAAASLVAVFGLLPHAEREPPRARPRLVLGLAAFALAAGAAVQGRPRAGSVLPPQGMARLEAVVEDHSLDGAGRGRAVLRIVSGARLEDGAPIPPGIHLSAGPAPMPNGALIRVLARVSARAPFRNPSPHPEPPRRFEIVGHAAVSDPHALRLLAMSNTTAALEAARQYVRQRLVATLPAHVAGVARALVLGDDRAVDAEATADVREAGLLHVFAVSGLHVAILAGLFVRLVEGLLLRWTRLAARFEARRIASALGVPAVLLYAEFAGGAPSAWRAAVTAALAWTLIALGRRPDMVAMTAAAGIVLGALDPTQVVRPAFLLSIVATSAILGGEFARARDLRGFLRDAFALSARTALATAPIALWFFGSVPLAGVLANVVLLPFGSLLLVQLSALHALACTLSPFAAITALPFVAVCDAFLTACEAFARLWPAPAWPPPDVGQGLVAALAAAAVLLLRSPRSRCLAAVVAVLLLGLLELRLRLIEQPHAQLRVTFVDVGQGDAALIDLPDGRLMLIDAGGNPGGGPDPGRRVLLPLLQARRRSRIDIAVLTHPHPDHYGGLAALLEQLPVGELWDSGQAEAEAGLAATSTETIALLAKARARGTRVLGPAQLCGTPRTAAGARIAVLAPCPRHDPGYDPNDNSLVLRIDYAGHGVLFAGDAEAHEETRLLESGARLAADVLKVAHHGSRTSTGEAFLRAVAPKLAIISAGASNRFGHPHPEVLERLRRGVPHVLGLAEVGGTTLRIANDALHVSTWSGQRLRLASNQARPTGTTAALTAVR